MYEKVICLNIYTLILMYLKVKMFYSLSFLGIFYPEEYDDYHYNYLFFTYFTKFQYQRQLSLFAEGYLK